jgi:hypothetical protein
MKDRTMKDRTTRTKLVFVFTLLLLCVSAESRAAGIFYVDNSGSPVCSNTPTNGSAANPWCTVSYGVGRLASGDTLLVKNGTYNESFTISGHDGTPSARTKILAFPDHKPILRGAGNTGRIKIAGTSYLDFEGFEITNYQQGLFINDDEGTKSPANNINVRNVTVHDVFQEGIGIRGNASFILLEGVTVYNTGLGSQNGEGIYVGGQNDADQTNHITIRNSLVHDVKDEGIELKHDTHGIIVEGNRIQRAMTPGSSFSSGGGAIETNSSRGAFIGNPNHIIRNNIISDMTVTAGITKYAIQLDVGATVYNNVIYNIASPIIAIQSASDDGFPRLVYHNTIDVPSSRAVVNSGGTALDSRNNIGPATTSNVATSDSFYVNKAGANYRLAAGSAPIDAGLNLTSIVSTDITGASRLTSLPPDLGAYEFGSGGSSPSPPTNLTLQ